MKTAALLLLFLLSGTLTASEPSATLDLPATNIFSKGPNTYTGDILNITRGRGAIIGWYIQAAKAEDVQVSIEYASARPLNQAYQLSFDGHDHFWNVPPTADPNPDSDNNNHLTHADLGTFQVRPGLPLLILLVPPSGTKYQHPVRFRKLILKGHTPGNLTLIPNLQEPPAPTATPGFGEKLNALHPALEYLDLATPDLTLRISGMALRSPTELLFTTWEGDLYSLDLDTLSSEPPPPIRHIAQGLSEPMGLATTNDRIFVTEKNEVTELLDHDNDGLFETYRCLAHDWPATMDYHEYLFGAVIKDSHLYFSSSVGMAARGKDNYQAPLRGSAIAVHIDTGKTDIIAGGLRTPDGIGLGPNDSILITDNQGEWLPANKLIHLQKGAHYQFRSIPPWHPLDQLQSPTPPAVWLPQGEIASSPTEPILLPSTWGPYANHVLFGDATFGGLQRVFLEEVDGIMQGAVFPFSQGFRHLFHRFAFGPNGDLYAGGIARGQDQEFIKRVSGLSRIRYNGKPVFEPLAARLKANGLEIEFTQPLAQDHGWNPAGYHVSQWGYQGTQTYGGQKVRPRIAEVRSATVSTDRRRVFIELPGLTLNEVIHVRLPTSLPSESGLPLWTGDLWYTVNQIPKNLPGEIRPAPAHTNATTTPFFQFSKTDTGRVLYQNFCSTCHSLDSTPLAGPTLHGLIGSTRKVRDTTGKTREIKADATYLRQSILEPNTLLSDGYPENLMPPIGAILTPDQLDALIDYIIKASKKK